MNSKSALTQISPPAVPPGTGLCGCSEDAQHTLEVDEKKLPPAAAAMDRENWDPVTL
jgi:hypothetical protein